MFASAANTYGLNLSLKSNPEMKSKLTNIGKFQQRTVSLESIASTAVDPCSSSEREDFDQEECVMEPTSKHIKKQRKEYKICTVAGCSRSYYSEKRYKKHLLEHFSKLMKKLVTGSKSA